MARSSSKTTRKGGARRWLASAGLLIFGAVIGVLLGAILDGPRMLVRRWTTEVQVLELPQPAAEVPNLDEFEALQAKQTKAEPAPEVPPVSEEPFDAGEETPAEEEPAGPTAEELIAELRKERAAAPEAPKPVVAEVELEPPPAPNPPAPGPPQEEEVPTSTGRSGAVVQVAAYRDVTDAETLVRRLRRAGYDAYLSDLRADGPNKYRVRVQPPGGGSVRALSRTLESRGYGVWVTKE